MSYENINGLVDLDAPSRFKIAVVGEQKVGKTNLALSMPGTIFHCDFDTRAEAVKDFLSRHPERKSDVVSKTYTDVQPQIPTAVAELEKDIATFEYLKAQGKPIPETFILDSMTYLRAYCEHELMKQQPEFARKIKLGAAGINIAKGWDIINGNRGYLEYLIGRLEVLGNVIAIFHELDESDKQRSTKEEKKYTGRKTIQPQYLASILSIFNDIFRVTVDYSGNRKVQVQPSSDFLASTSMKLDKEEPADLGLMIAKHKKASGI